ncbi:hypothetical protein Poli38472_007560 [Pythium oligandrum]|uniref:BZIP domain-containing protein n=1 Tax=Pythium oligandrum TaxID=41045 RepID=A0A8K1FRT1_PYTOL|nr:hypothetical protein Poli38472_007560 [Pythium oligandrum]|eukprot:TMW67888.1 hypothetical protein Poli38472_007560 [Pythium oligandrum]
MELEADLATLDAIVAFLDDYDAAESESLLSSSLEVPVQVTGSSSSSGSDEDERPKRTKRSLQKAVNSNRARERKKREFLRLQQEAEELDKQVTSLLEAKATRMSSMAQENAKHSLALHRERMAAWKEMAVRQFRRRNAAEAENMRLKELVVEQRDVLRGLHRILERQLTNNKIQSCDAARQSISSWTTSWQGDPRAMMQTVAELLSGIKTAYDSTDSWLATTCSMRSAGLDNKAQVIALSPTQYAIEVVNLRFLPFDSHRVAEAYWIMGMNYYCRDFDISREVADVEGRETLFLNQAFQDHGSGHVNVRKHSSVQRFDEKDRVVILVASRYSSIQVQGEELTGVTCSEMYWSIFKVPEGGAQDTCLWVFSERSTLDVHQGETLSMQTLGLLHEYFETKMKRDIDTIMALMEDWLLQSPQALKPGL